MNELRYSGPSFGPVTRELLGGYTYQTHGAPVVQIGIGATRPMTPAERNFRDTLREDLLKLSMQMTRYIIDNAMVHRAKGQAPFPISRVRRAVVELLGDVT